MIQLHKKVEIAHQTVTRSERSGSHDKPFRSKNATIFKFHGDKVACLAQNKLYLPKFFSVMSPKRRLPKCRCWINVHKKNKNMLYFSTNLI